MPEVARVSAAQLTDRGQQGEAEAAPPRPRLSLGQIFCGTGKEIVEVPIELVHRDESQAREEFDKGRLEELAASIRQEGIIEPLELRPDAGQEGQFVIIWGERRWRAAQLAGLATVPAVINREPKHVRRRQLYENVMREDLNSVELARVVAQTMEEDGLDSKGMAEQLRWPLRKVQRLIEIHEAPVAREDRHGQGNERRWRAAGPLEPARARRDPGVPALREGRQDGRQGEGAREAREAHLARARRGVVREEAPGVRRAPSGGADGETAPGLPTQRRATPETRR